jgi:signal transduction histidine kinase
VTRRLTIAIVGVVAGALLLAGLGTLLLVRLSARDDTRQELEDQVTSIAARSGSLAEVDPRRPAPRRQARPAFLELVRVALELQGAELMRFRPDGSTIDLPPAGIDLGDLRFEQLRAGQVVSGTNGSLVYAAAPVRRGPALAVVVLTRRADAGLRSGGRWFAVAAVAAVAAAIAVAASLGSRLTRPIRAVEAATRRIASGDLTARIAVDTHVDDELASLARSVNAMAEELDRSRRLERQFLLSVSHDLRTPLTSIRGFAEAIADGAATDHAQAATVISSEARRLERLVRDLLDLARIDARQFSLDLRPTDVGDVVNETAEGFRPAAEDAGVDLRVVADAGELIARTDPDRLAQAVANLMENALKFATSSIEVAARAADGHVLVSVDDDGPGIDEAELGRVFERLYSASRSPARQVGTGSGLGLAIVHDLVEAMGGAVRAERSPAGGSRLVLSLPSSSTSSS